MQKHFSRKEAQQLAAVAAVAVVVLGYGLWRFAVVPLREASRANIAKHAELLAKNKTAQEALSAVPGHEAALAAMNEGLDRIVRDYAVRPILGSSYQLGLRQRIDPLAQKASFTIHSVTVQDPEPLPQRRPGAPLSLCAAEIRGLGSFAEIRDFLAFIETDNPYLHVAGLAVGAHPNDPKRHRVTLRLECVSAPAEPQPL